MLARVRNDITTKCEARKSSRHVTFVLMSTISESGWERTTIHYGAMTTSTHCACARDSVLPVLNRQLLIGLNCMLSFSGTCFKAQTTRARSCKKAPDCELCSIASCRLSGSASLSEARLWDCPLASQGGCAVPASLKRPVGWFVCGQATWRRGRHAVTVQRCCPANAVLGLGGDVGGALGASDVGGAPSHLPVCQFVTKRGRDVRLASIYNRYASCCPIG